MSYEADLTAADVKAKAKECGADIVGIAPMSRWEGTDRQHDPRYIFPGAQSMIVLGFRIPRGSLRGVEEGTHFLNFATMGYAALNAIYGPMVLWELNRYLEDHGYEAVPLANVSGGEAVNPLTGRFRAGWSRPVRPGLPAPDVSVDFRVAAFLAGLGEFGYSRAFLTPEFGPRQRFAVMLTDAALDPDPLYAGRICDRCMECVKNCHGGCISPTETVKKAIGGVEVEWGKRDELACSRAAREGGLRRELSPFDGSYPRKYGYGLAHEGACGCIRACMVHLEARAKMTRGFRNPFRKPGWKQWEVDHAKPYEIPAEIREAYAGNIEAHDAYTNYNINSNYGTKAAAGLVQDNASSGGVA